MGPDRPVWLESTVLWPIGQSEIMTLSNTLVSLNKDVEHEPDIGASTKPHFAPSGKSTNVEKYHMVLFLR